MDLIGDCRLKGATRVIEDLEHADPRQHPRNLLPGQWNALATKLSIGNNGDKIINIHSPTC